MPLQYLQPGQSYAVASYVGQPSVATPSPASLCSVNIQHAASAASYTPPSVQAQTAAGVAVPVVSQHVAQSYQAPGHQQQQAVAADSLAFPLQVQQTQSFVTQTEQHAQSALGYPMAVQQQTAIAATTLPAQQPAQSYALASVAPHMGAAGQCHPAQAHSTLQQVQVTVKLPSKQPVQSSSTPALYSQQIPIHQEHQQPLLQHTQSTTQQTQKAGQAYIQPQLQPSQETGHPIHQQMVQQPMSQSQSLQSSSQQQPLQHHSPKTIQTAMAKQSHDASQSTVLQVQTLSSRNHPATITQVVAANHQSCPAPSLLDTVSETYAHCALNMLQQQTQAQSQYQPAQSNAVPQIYGGANQVVTPQSLPVSFQHSQPAHITQQVRFTLLCFFRSDLIFLTISLHCCFLKSGRILLSQLDRG